MSRTFLRVIIDTNIILSAAIFQNSIPGQAYYRAIERCTVISSVETLQEMIKTFARPNSDRYLSAKEERALP